MNANLSQVLLVAVVVVGAANLTREAQAQHRVCYRTRTVYVQPKPEPRPPQPVAAPKPAPVVCEPELPALVSGAAYTLYGSFFGKEPGKVFYTIGGTVHECQLLDWKPDAVTIELPMLGLTAPQIALVQIVREEGRVAKSIKVRVVNQPDIVQHDESIPQPSPPAADSFSPPRYVGDSDHLDSYSQGQVEVIAGGFSLRAS